MSVLWCWIDYIRFATPVLKALRFGLKDSSPGVQASAARSIGTVSRHAGVGGLMEYLKITVTLQPKAMGHLIKDLTELCGAEKDAQRYAAAMTLREVG